jgi:excisionase family DNA binding protein
MLQHTSAPVVQPAPAVSALGVVDIASICELLGVSRSWLENTIRQDETFPRPFKIGARRLVKFADLQAWVEQKARAA